MLAKLTFISFGDSRQYLLLPSVLSETIRPRPKEYQGFFAPKLEPRNPTPMSPIHRDSRLTQTLNPEIRPNFTGIWASLASPLIQSRCHNFAPAEPGARNPLQSAGFLDPNMEPRYPTAISQFHRGSWPRTWTPEIRPNVPSSPGFLTPNKESRNSTTMSPFNRDFLIRT